MTSSSLPEFHLPTVNESTNGWGPSSLSLPSHLLGLPFMPFNKSERLSKISDWSFQHRDNRGGSASTASSNVKVAEEEEIGIEGDEGGAFSIVDSKVKIKPRGWSSYRPFQQQNKRQQQQQQQSNSNNTGNQQQQQQHQQQQQQQQTGQQGQKRASTAGTASQQQQQQSGQQRIAANTGTPASTGVSKPSTLVGSTAWNTLASSGGTTQWQGQQQVKRGTGSTGASTSSQSFSNSNSSRQQQQNNRNRGNQRDNRRGGFGFDVKDSLQPSVVVAEDWKLTAEIEFADLIRITYQPKDSEDLMFAGTLLPFNPAYNRVNPRSAVPLSRYENRQFFAASTTEDPLLNNFINEHTGNIYATDSILALLMSASKSVYGWDIIVKKTADGIILDKRAESKIDWLSQNENHREGLSEDAENINHPDQLALESTVISHNFSQQVLFPTAASTSTVGTSSVSLSSAAPLNFPISNPFLSSLAAGNEPANVGFRYTKFDLGPNTSLVCRSSINAYTKKPQASGNAEDEADDQDQYNYIITRILNEFDSKISGSVDWRTRLESQTGAVLAIEMKNNSYRLHRYVSEMLLTKADSIVIGFISRNNTSSSFKHSILLTKNYQLQTFADSLNIKVKGLWGSLKVIIDKLNALEVGNYLMVRDPNKTAISIYQVPAEIFQQEGEGAVENTQSEE